MLLADTLRLDVTSLIRRSAYAFAHDEEGSSLVETAASLTIFLVVFLSIIDASRAFYAHHYVAYASRQAARYAMVRGSSWSGTSCAATATFDCDATSTDIQNFVTSLVPPGVSRSKVKVTTVWSGLSPSGSACLSLNGTNSPGCSVRVNVTYPYNSLIPFIPAETFLFTSTATVVIAQ
jgi:Flp pilus assembly protein TadG